LLAAHADRAGRDHGADRAAPLSRDPARRHLAAVVAGRLRDDARRGDERHRHAAARPDAPGRARHGHGRERVVAAVEKPSRLDERRAEFKRYKEDVAGRGKPFYPYAMFHDTVMSLVVVGVIVGLACIWKWTSWAPHHDGTHQGLLGPEYTAPADPGTDNFVPRPDWYFYFLFYLLRVFKWPDSVFLGTVGVPNICLVLLIALPFMDRRRTRKLSQRPV